MRYAVMMCVVGTMTATAAQAQEPAMAAKMTAEREAMVAGFQNTRISVESRTTKGAPYSAEAVTESVQVLADGNRIVTKNATRVFRDGEGRTRREQLNAAGTDVTTINISDPVAGTGTTFVVDPSSHTAYRNGLIFTTVTDTGAAGAPVGGFSTMTMTRTSEGGVTVARQEMERKQIVEVQTAGLARATADVKVRAADPSGATTFVSGGMLAARTAEVSGQTMTREELGQQMVEGVTAVGTRTTTEIPAGAIGNEQPIRVVSEQWFSPELQVLVMTRHTDPRVGETVYRLTGIVRAEPSRSLFEPPSDYNVKESVIRRDER